jgi:hypothetical protein
MTSRLTEVVIDCHHPRELAAGTGCIWICRNLYEALTQAQEIECEVDETTGGS